MLARVRIAVLAVAPLALAATLAGCGGSSSPSASSAAPAATVASVASTHPSKPSRAAKVVTLTEWDWASPAAGLVALVKQWNSTHPTVQVKEVVQPFNSYFTLERAAITAKTGPDVVINYGSPFIFSFYQGFLNLAHYVTPYQRKNLTEWNLGSLGLSNTGAPYAVPWGEQNVVFYYNKSLFAKAGLNPNQPPATWAQFLADCKALKSHGIVPISAGWKDGYYAEWWTSVFAPQFMTPSEQAAFIRHPNWASKPITTALGYMRQLSQAGYMTPSALGLTLFPQAVDNFHAGKGAIILSLSANNANFSEYKSLGAKLGTFRPPVLPGSHFASPQMEAEGGLSWSITKWSPHPAQAYAFISFLAQADSQNTAFKLSAFVPNNLQSNPTTTSAAGRQILQWVHGTTYPGVVDIAFLANVEPAFDKTIPEVISGTLSPLAAMQQVQQAEQQAPPIPGVK